MERLLDDITKDNIDIILRDLAKIYKKLSGGKIKAELVVVGEAAILERYGFRDITSDVDAIIFASSAIKEAVNIVGDKYNLRNSWLNSDFKFTSSYSDKIVGVSKFYKTFYGVIDVRIVYGEYLIAIKLKSGRIYKKDMSDIAGILNEHRKSGDDISIERIMKAVEVLYGSTSVISSRSLEILNYIFESNDYESAY